MMQATEFYIPAILHLCIPTEAKQTIFQGNATLSHSSPIFALFSFPQIKVLNLIIKLVFTLILFLTISRKNITEKKISEK
ncbi:hypothetical protein H6G35_32975 [Aulosira sp. FACHB-113]|nr:hypothetical protein [Aulosira sp. FACHB-113]